MTSSQRIVRGLFLGLVGCLVLAGCSDDPAAPADPYATADGMNGGMLYDTFWAEETGYVAPDGFDFAAHADFFRCKQCHGWDRLGTSGAYANRGPRTSRPNISSLDLKAYAASRSAQQIYNGLVKTTDRRGLDADLSTYDPATNATVGDQMPDLNEIFTAAELWDLAKFLKDDAVDGDELYDITVTGAYPTATISYGNLGPGGDPVRGNELYAQQCAHCHGPDGTIFLVDGRAYTVGRHVRSKPYEGQHKIKFGQLGSVMGSTLTDLQDLKDMYAALSDATLYPDQRPVAR